MTGARGHKALAFAALVLLALAAPDSVAAEATPMFTFTQQLAIDTVKGAAGSGLKYYSPYLYGGSLAVDFALEAGKAGVEERDRTLGEKMVRSEELGKRLKAMRAAGIPTHDSPEADKIRQELFGISRYMRSDRDGLAYAAYAAGQHPLYALGKPALGLALDKYLEHLGNQVGLDKFVKRLPFGRKVKQWLGRESPFKLYRRAVGWDNLASRSTAARVITDELVKSMIKASANKFVKALFDGTEEAVRGDVWYDRYQELHREPLVYTNRLEVARLLLPIVPAMPAAPAPVAAAPAVPPFEIAAAPAAASVPFDPVGRVVGSENLLVSAAPAMRQGPIERQTEMREAPPPPEVSMHEDDRRVPDVDVDSYFSGKSFGGNSAGLWGF